MPTPDGKFTANCSYVLDDFSESASGYRFVADATLRNTGNIGIVARVTATWNQSGSGPMREVKNVKVPYRRNKVVHFTRICKPGRDLPSPSGGDGRSDL